MTMKHTLATLLLLCCALAGAAQPFCTVTSYNENDGLAQRHVTQVLQDHQGFIWFATWNGLSRFDGYEFRTFKSRVGDGCHMTTDRIRNMVVSPDDEDILYCRVDEQYFRFSLTTYQFQDITGAEARRAAEAMSSNRHTISLLKQSSADYTDRYGNIWTVFSNGTLGLRSIPQEPSRPWPLEQSLGEVRFVYPDRQDNLWLLGHEAVYKLSFHQRRFTPFPQERPAEVGCLFADWSRRFWIATKDDATLRIYDSDSRLLGYVAADGRLSQRYTSFGHAVYSIHQESPDVFWIGTKPDGLFRLTRQSDDAFRIEHFPHLPNPNVYDIKTIADPTTGRKQLWVATLGGGVCYAPLPVEPSARFTVPAGYPREVCQRVREIYRAPRGELLIATTEGLVVSDRRHRRFVRHQKEPERHNSLSSDATMNICHDADGRIFVSTESGGVNRIVSTDLTAPRLDFAHYDSSNGLTPNDIALSLNLMEGRLLVVSSNLLYVLDSDGRVDTRDSRFFHANLRFSDAHPIVLSDGSWLVGTMDGAFTMSPVQRRYDDAQPRIVLTHVIMSDGTDRMAVERDSIITLPPTQRSLSISFATLDYRDPTRVTYWFTLRNRDDGESPPAVTQLGHSHTITLPELKPGTYELAIRSTNADGQPTKSVRRLTIVVEPRFAETTLAHVLITLLVLLVVGAAIYTYIYIRRLNRKQRDTLEAYLRLLDEQTVRPPVSIAPAETVAPVATSPDDDAFMQRVMAYVEQHLADSNANVGDMADACAVSRSGLQRKMKHLLGVTPQDFLREARIQRATQLLRTTSRPVSDIAYQCGFSDPKYFSRIYKASTGQSPSELRA